MGIPMRLRYVTHRVNFLGGLLFFGIPFVTIFIGEKTVDASIAAVVFSCGPVFSVTMARIFLKERLTPYRIAAILLGLSGIFYLYLPALLSAGFRANMGLFLILVGALAGAGGVIVVKKYLHHEDPSVALPHQMVMVAPVIFIASLLMESYKQMTITPAFLVSLLYLALLSSGVAYVLFFWMLKHVDISQIVYIDFIDPVLSIIFASLLLGEAVSARLAVSTALIVAGGFLATRGA